jgi:hypothetical protein
MNTEDAKRFARLEIQIIDQGKIHNLFQLNEFPYKTFKELKNAYENNEIKIGCKFNSEFINLIGTSSQNNAFLFWTNLPIIVMLIDIVLAICFKDWLLLLGIPFAIIGFLSSSPFSPKILKIFTGAIFLMFIASFKIINWKWSIILGSMLSTQIFIEISRELYRSVAIERALSSEVFFCYMYLSKFITVKDIKSNKIYYEK